jgi:O-methyltransferase
MNFFSKIINGILSPFGLKVAKLKSIATLEKDRQLLHQYGGSPLRDIRDDTAFMKIYSKVESLTLVGLERCYALYQSIRYIHENNIGGDIVECGVWKGGSAMLIMYTLIELGDQGRKVWLYDTFEGMPEPGTEDGEKVKSEWHSFKARNEEWCLASVEEVKRNMAATGYPGSNIVFVQGRVEETIPATMPGSISLLRLDTDWYSSTRHELQYLYPLLNQKGILFIDDYGAWQGARKATDEYFAASPVLLQRVDWTGRLVIKP